jgi:hypothetical protein
MGWDPYVTHLQKLAWIEWLRIDMDRPGKVEWYQMMVGCEVRRVLSMQPSQHQPGHLVLNFTNEALEGVDELDDIDTVKERDIAAFGRGGVYTPPPGPVPEDEPVTDYLEDPIE